MDARDNINNNTFLEKRRRLMIKAVFVIAFLVFFSAALNYYNCFELKYYPVSGIITADSDLQEVILPQDKSSSSSNAMLISLLRTDEQYIVLHRQSSKLVANVNVNQSENMKSKSFKTSSGWTKKDFEKCSTTLSYMSPDIFYLRC